MTSKDVAVLDRLPRDEREVLILANFYGLARDEIASLIGASVDIVDALTTRAVEHLRYILTSGGLQVRAA